MEKTYSELLLELKDVLGVIYNTNDDRARWEAKTNNVPVLIGKGNSPQEALADLKKQIDERKALG